ncbi:hypothetical protein WN51_13895 [Melipona quadrifasciata]|uniref:Uncharacterized protein n=1 Tax=Melipona quadrifasciata TaxID=166423 RepID=A0A0M8ZZ17_9HYME|nr:hypothetical protein WN51_13895 [Melipona quadrifasciata]
MWTRINQRDPSIQNSSKLKRYQADTTQLPSLAKHQTQPFPVMIIAEKPSKRRAEWQNRSPEDMKIKVARVHSARVLACVITSRNGPKFQRQDAIKDTGSYTPRRTSRQGPRDLGKVASDRLGPLMKTVSGDRFVAVAILRQNGRTEQVKKCSSAEIGNQSENKFILLAQDGEFGRCKIKAFKTLNVPLYSRNGRARTRERKDRKVESFQSSRTSHEKIFPNRHYITKVVMGEERGSLAFFKCRKRLRHRRSSLELDEIVHPGAIEQSSMSIVDLPEEVQYTRKTFPEKIVAVAGDGDGDGEFDGEKTFVLGETVMINYLLL